MSASEKDFSEIRALLRECRRLQLKTRQERVQFRIDFRKEFRALAAAQKKTEQSLKAFIEWRRRGGKIA
jgi:hypothetical protein